LTDHGNCPDTGSCSRTSVFGTGPLNCASVQKELIYKSKKMIYNISVDNAENRLYTARNGQYDHKSFSGGIV
jgi:hypothetical protein